MFDPKRVSERCRISSLWPILLWVRRDCSAGTYFQKHEYFFRFAFSPPGLGRWTDV